MAFHIRRADYFYATVKDRPGEAYRILEMLGGMGINLLAFTAVPTGIDRTQLALFPEDPAILIREAGRAKLELDGPYPAILAQGDDEIGALRGIHERLFRANVNIYAATAVADGKGDYGYIIYVRPEDFEKGMEALGI